MVAQGYQESQLDQNAKSQVGAVGVMQVMPATGKDLKVGDIRQIEPNIHAGVKYIRFMIDQYFNNEPMDAAEQGTVRVRRLQRRPGPHPRSCARKPPSAGLDPNVWFNNVERIVREAIGRETVHLREQHLQVLRGVPAHGRRLDAKRRRASPLPHPRSKGARRPTTTCREACDRFSVTHRAQRRRLCANGANTPVFHAASFRWLPVRRADFLLFRPRPASASYEQEGVTCCVRCSPDSSFWR